LFTSSSEGKTVILRIVEPGEVLGLTAVIGDTPYEATAETIEPSQAHFISRRDFLSFMEEHPDVGMKVAQQLTHNCKCAYDEIRSLGLSGSVPEKIAKLLLSWAERPLGPPRKESPGIPIRVTLTQEEIAQLTGTVRETVSRVLRDFKRNGWLRIKGATWFLLKKEELEKLVTT
jgi:CRP/FNR family cyclic AMP-dependent transcriptional regulator